jgi:hypothetical protein
MNKYPSKYSNGKTVTAAQFITEIICERIAKKNKKDLHYRFWVSSEWEKEYKGQIATAHKLLKKYNPKTIISALSTSDGVKIYSLRAPHLIDIVDRQAKKELSQKDHTHKPPVDRNFLQEGKQNSGHKKNILDKLKDIDNGSNSR